MNVKTPMQLKFCEIQTTCTLICISRGVHHKTVDIQFFFHLEMNIVRVESVGMWPPFSTTGSQKVSITWLALHFYYNFAFIYAKIYLHRSLEIHAIVNAANFVKEQEVASIGGSIEEHLLCEHCSKSYTCEKNSWDNNKFSISQQNLSIELMGVLDTECFQILYTHLNYIIKVILNVPSHTLQEKYFTFLFSSSFQENRHVTSGVQ